MEDHILTKYLILYIESEIVVKFSTKSIINYLQDLKEGWFSFGYIINDWVKMYQENFISFILFIFSYRECYPPNRIGEISFNLTCGGLKNNQCILNHILIK